MVTTRSGRTPAKAPAVTKASPKKPAAKPSAAGKQCTGTSARCGGRCRMRVDPAMGISTCVHHTSPSVWASAMARKKAAAQKPRKRRPAASGTRRLKGMPKPTGTRLVWSG